MVPISDHTQNTQYGLGETDGKDCSVQVADEEILVLGARVQLGDDGGTFKADLNFAEAVHEVREYRS